MDKQKKLLAAGGVAALVLIGGWVLASSVATSRAEDALYGVLDQYKLRDAIQWQDLSASPFGTATLKGVVIRSGQGKSAEKMAIQRLVLSDVDNSPERKRLRIEVSGVADESGFSPLARTDVLQAAGRTDLPPFSFTFSVDLNGGADAGALHVSLDQPKAFKTEASLEVTHLRDLLRLANRLADSELDEIPAVLGGLGFYGPLGMLGAVGNKVQALEVRSVKASVKDDGYVARSRALVLRHDVALVPGTEASKQRSQWLKDKESQGKKQCKVDPEGAFDGAPLTSDDCLALLDFITGGSSKLAVNMVPARPVSLEQLFGGRGGRDAYRPLRLLDMRLDN